MTKQQEFMNKLDKMNLNDNARKVISGSDMIANYDLFEGLDEGQINAICDEMVRRGF